MCITHRRRAELLWFTVRHRRRAELLWFTVRHRRRAELLWFTIRHRRRAELLWFTARHRRRAELLWFTTDLRRDLRQDLRQDLRHPPRRDLRQAVRERINNRGHIKCLRLLRTPPSMRPPISGVERQDTFSRNTLFTGVPFFSVPLRRFVTKTHISFVLEISGNYIDFYWRHLQNRCRN